MPPLPAPGMMPAQPAMGMSQYPPTFSYSMGGFQNPNEQLATRMAGGFLGGAQGLVGGLGTINTIAGIGAFGAGVLGFGVPAAAGMAGSLPVGLGLGFAGGALSGMSTGFQQSGQVNQIFGNQYFANPRNAVGRGFDARQLQTLYGAVSAIQENDPFVTMQDALRVTQRFGSEFGIQQGIRDADELSRRVTQLGKTLASMAKTMGTTIDEAGQMFGMARQAGFYSPEDVMGFTQEGMMLRGRGFTLQQTGQISAAGAGMSRSMGLSGRAGAAFATGMVSDLSSLMERGTLSEQALMDATGTVTRNDAAMALAQMSQGVFQRTATTGYGRALLAGLMQTDEQGNFAGIDQTMLQEMQAGRLGASQIRDIGGRKLSTRQGQLAFLNNEDLLLGEFMGSDDAMSGLLRALEKTSEDTGTDLQQLVRQVTGLQSRDYRILKDTVDAVRETRDARLRDLATELQTQERQRFTSENRTFGGLRQQITGGFEDIVAAPFRQMGVNFRTSAGVLGERFSGSLFGVSRFRTPTSEIDRIAEASTLSIMTGGDQDLARRLGADTDLAGRIGGQSLTLSGQIDMAAMIGNEQEMSSLLSGLRGPSSPSLTSGNIKELRRKAEEMFANPENAAEKLKEMRRVIGRGEAESDAEIIAALGDLGTAAVRAGRAADPQLDGTSGRYKSAQEASRAMASLIGASPTEAYLALTGGSLGFTLGGGLGGALGAQLLGGTSTTAKLRAAAEAGSGSSLIAAAKDSSKMENIDRIIARTYRLPGKAGDRSAVVKALKEAGIDATASDVEVYEAIMASKTGKGIQERSSEGNYEQYKEVREMASDIAQVLEGEALSGVAEARGAFAATAKMSLGALGVEGEGIKGLLESAASSGRVTEEAVAGMAPQAQLVAREAAKIRSLQKRTGPISRRELFDVLGVDPGGEVAKALDAQIGRSGQVSADKAVELAMKTGEARLESFAIRGAGAMGAALREGKTELQLQSEAVQKVLEMTDALYSRMSGAPPLMDSALAKAQYDPDAGAWSPLAN